MPEDLGERTEQPTARRLAQARRRGQVAKSTDLSAAIDLGGAVVLLVALGGSLVASMVVTLRGVLDGQAPGDPLRVDGLTAAGWWVAGRIALAAVPLTLLVAVVAAVGQLIQVGWLVTFEPLRPRLDRLNPITGLKRLFSRRNLVKSAVNVGKLAIVIVVALLVVRRHIGLIPALPLMDLLPAVGAVGRMALELAVALLVLLVLLGLADLVYQRWQHIQDLKMTRQEVKEERRAMEGDPEIRGRRLRMARDIAMQRIRQTVPKADVVVANPTHFSVALRYDAATMRAPKVVAKGADHLALRIRYLALSAGVPIVRRPPLARALYWNVPVGQEIRPEHYEAVAEVLAYVYRLNGRAA